VKPVSEASPCGEGEPSPASRQSEGLSLDALRARGAPRLDPAHFRYIEALASRTAAHQGALRRALDRKLALALATCAARCAAVQSEAGTQAGQQAQAEGQTRKGLLGELLVYIDRQALSADAALSSPAALPQPDAPWPELKALRDSRSIWQRLSVDKQLSQSLQKVPDNPGPLNSQLLVLRSLRLMQDISPAYLKRFMAHVEALLWLEGASPGSGPAALGAGAPAPSAAPGESARRGLEKKKRKPARGKAG
jgi:hypothetical protein